MNDINTPITNMGLWSAYMETLRGNLVSEMACIAFGGNPSTKNNTLWVGSDIRDMGLWKAYVIKGGSVKELEKITPFETEEIKMEEKVRWKKKEDEKWKKK